MSDLLRFEILYVFFPWVKQSKMFVMSVEECIDVLKLALGERIAVEVKW